MLKRKKSLSFMMVFFLLFSFIIPVNEVKAETNAVEVTKTVSSTTMTTKDEVEVTLGLKGTPPVNVVQPNDVILIMDKSGSMKGDKIIASKEAAKGFVDLMDLTKHRVGVVDFQTSPGNFPLTTDGESIKNYIDTIQQGGGTNTAAAIKTAITALANHRTEAQPVIVILTDGAADSFDDAKLAAKQAKDAGIVFYTVALLGKDENPDISAQNLLLKEMATTAQHHHFVLGSTGLKEIYADLVKEIGIVSVRNVVLTDVVSPEFEIVPGSFDQNIPRPTVSGNTLTWNFLELKSDILTFTYKVRPRSKDVTGVFPISSGSTIQYKNYLGNTEKLNIINSNITIKYPKPDITAVTPDKSEITGGSEITIKGTDFRKGAVVTVNSASASNVQVISENEIKATVPAGTQGESVIKVKNTDGQYDEEKHHYFANPIVTTITPDKGLIDGGTKVAISGKYFLPGAKVFLNNIEATSIYLSGQSITATAPKSDSVGAVDVKVVNPDGTEVIVSNGFTYEMLPAPSITSISPKEGKLAGGETVDINGDNFKTGATVKVGGQDAAKIVFIEGTRIRILVPASVNAGAIDVVVTNPDGQSVTLKDGYTYLAPVLDPAPSITSISPKEGKLIGGETVDICGDNFKIGAIVKIGGQDAAKIVFVEKTRVRILVPASSTAGTADVVVTNPDGQSVTLKGGYTYLEPVVVRDPAPSITSISPKEGKLIGGETVDICGDNFKIGAIVKIGGQDAAKIVFVEKTRVRILVPASSTAGTADVVVTNP
ncbi:IPT/TIG domain-containing protein, partial [Clostridium gasigenes]|uniref:IPT/TIG domain-containing protein n=1 Tax=Clostridium gasigenes TaxID=94869 RepID=UPI001C0D047E